MRIIILGCNGILGRALTHELGSVHDLAACDVDHYDIRDPGPFSSHLDRFRPGAVINAAAYTQVDRAEDEPELAMEVNGEAPGRLAEACKRRGVRFVHLGTDYVFNGKSERPWRENDPTDPLSVYGKTKLRGEQTVAAAHPSGHLIVRTSWLFGHGGKSFVRTMLGRFRDGMRSFRVVNDQYGRPTYAPDLARVIGRAVELGLTGTYHAANTGDLSWYEFAREIFAAAGVGDQVEITPVTTNDYPTRAVRPAYSVLDTSKIEAALGEAMPHYRDALQRYLMRERERD